MNAHERPPVAPTNLFFMVGKTCFMEGTPWLLSSVGALPKKMRVCRLYVIPIDVLQKKMREYRLYVILSECELWRSARRSQSAARGGISL